MEDFNTGRIYLGLWASQGHAKKTPHKRESKIDKKSSIFVLYHIFRRSI